MKKICPLIKMPCIKEKCIGLDVDNSGKPRRQTKKVYFGYCTALKARILRSEVEG